MRRVSKPKLFATVASMGDSIPTFGGTALVTPWTTEVDSFYHYMPLLAALSSAQVSILRTAAGLPYFATGGYTSAQVQSTHLPTVIAAKPDACVIVCGTNDYGAAVTSANSAATILAIVDSLLAAGITPILGEIIAVPSGQAAKAAWLLATNVLLAAGMATRKKALYVNWNIYLDSNGDGTADTDTWYDDTVHPNHNGYSRMGKRLYEVCQPWITPSDYFAGIVWDTPNPTLTGAGTVADGWNLDIAGTLTPSLVARGGALGNWQKLVITGSSANNNLRYGYGTASGGWAVGDTVEFAVEYLPVGNLSADFALIPKLYADGNLRCQAMRVTTAYADKVSLTGGVIVGPRYTIKAGDTAMWPYIYLYGTGTLQIGRCGYRKVS